MKKAQIFFLIMSLFPGLAWSQDVPQINWVELQATKPWVATEQWTPVPNKVNPGVYSSAPSDAFVLFDGKDLSKWEKPRYDYGARMDQVEAIIKLKSQDLIRDQRTTAEWEVKDGALIVTPGKGAIETALPFGDVQLHIEFNCPTDVGKKDQYYSNSGVFLMGLYEVQVLNSYENDTYPNGQAGALYKQHIPLVNASRPAGEWQSYDIIFRAPVFEDGNVLKPATITVLHNGVLIQDHVELKGPCVYIGEPYYTAHPEKMPLLLQDHGDKVRYRNIWVREL